jgi:hypothetical protein
MCILRKDSKEMEYIARKPALVPIVKGNSFGNFSVPRINMK